MIILNYVFYFLIFLITLFFFVFLPGKVVLSFLKIRLSFWEKTIVSLSLGIVFVTLLDFLLGWLGIRFLLVPFILAIALYIFRQKGTSFLKIKRLKRSAILGVLIISFASLIQSLLMIKSGLPYKEGLGFWGVHGYDGIWHLTLISELSRHFPPQNPGFAGASLKNYHYFSDLFMAIIARVSRLSVLDLYFRLFPLFLSFLFNSLVYLLAKRWSGKKEVAFWSVFFVSLAGSFGFIPPFFGIGSNNWETAFWGSQPASGLLNPPLFLSFIILTLGLLLLVVFNNKLNLGRVLIVGILFGSLVEFKIYAGLIVIASLGVLSLLQLIFKKRNDFLKIFIVSLIVALGLSLPSFDYSSTNFFIFQPLWFIRTMVSAPDRLNWINLELRRQMYAAWNYWPGSILVYFLGFIIFLIGNLGVRFIGFFSLFKKLTKINTHELFLVLLLLFSFFPSLLFLQKGIVWNTIQFFYYFIFIFSFFAAITFALLLKKIKSRLLEFILILCIISLALPSTLKTISWFIGATPASYIDRKEIEALEFLKEKTPPENTILTYPYDPAVRDLFAPPVPLTYYNAAYVSFFSQRRVYLEDQTAALIQGYDLEERLEKEKQFFSGKDVARKHQFLLQDNISFIYLVDDQKIEMIEELPLRKIFDNQKVQIYQICDKI